MTRRFVPARTSKPFLRPFGNTWGFYPAYDLTSLSGPSTVGETEVVDQIEGSIDRRLVVGFTISHACYDG